MRKLVIGIQMVKEKWDWLLNSFRSGIQVIKDVKANIGGMFSNAGGSMKGKLSEIFGFDDGGVVPGPIGKPQLAMVHGGETILPTHKTATAGAGTNANITINVSEKADWAYGVDLIKKELGISGVYANAGITN